MMRQAFYTITILVLFAGCKKEVDNIPPVISFQSPSTASYYGVFDSIFVSAQVIDESSLNWVLVDIIDGSNQAILSAQGEYNLSSPTFEVFERLILSDIHTTSGSYFIRIRASDGHNERTVFREIIIAEAPLEVLRTVSSSLTSNNSFSLDSLSGATWSPITSTEGSPGLLLTNSWHRELLLTLQNNGNIFVFGGNEFTLTQMTSGGGITAEPVYNFGIFDSGSRRYLLSKNDGHLEMRMPGGALSLSFSSSANMRPYTLGTYQQNFIVEERNLNGQLKQISTYNKTTGAFQQSSPLSSTLLKIIEEPNAAFLFGNTNGNTEIIRYLVDQNNMFNIATYEGKTLVDVQAFVESEGEQFYLLCFENSVEVLNSSNPTQLSPNWSWNEGGDEIDFDRANGIIYLRQGDQWFRLQSGNPTPEFWINLPPQTHNISILYNK